MVYFISGRFETKHSVEFGCIARRSLVSRSKLLRRLGLNR